MVDRDKQGEADEDVSVDPLYIDLSVAEVVKRAGVRLDAFTLMEASQDLALGQAVRRACENIVDARDWAPVQPPSWLDALPSDAPVIIRGAFHDHLTTASQAAATLLEARERQDKGLLTRTEAISILFNRLPGWASSPEHAAKQLDSAAQGGQIIYLHPRRSNSPLEQSDDDCGGLYPWWITDDGEAHIAVTKLYGWLSEADRTLLESARPSGAPRASERTGCGNEVRPLATPAELIAAFGPPFTQINDKWFKKITDRPGMERARIRKGTGGRGRSAHPPLFCPIAVMRELMHSSRGKDNVLSEAMGRLRLKQHFPDAYEIYLRENGDTDMFSNSPVPPARDK